MQQLQRRQADRRSGASEGPFRVTRRTVMRSSYLQGATTFCPPQSIRNSIESSCQLGSLAMRTRSIGGCGCDDRRRPPPTSPVLDCQSTRSLRCLPAHLHCEISSHRGPGQRSRLKVNETPGIGVRSSSHLQTASKTWTKAMRSLLLPLPHLYVFPYLHPNAHTP